MTRFLRLSSRTPAEAAMDEYFEKIGLWRKMIPKDGNSLYRIISEKIYFTQSNYENVVKICSKFLEPKINNISEIDLRWQEIRVLAITFKFDFVVYRAAGKKPEALTNYGFEKMISLCSVDSKHFDLVLLKKQVAEFSLCQSILYEIFYENILGMKNTVARSNEMVSTKVLTYSDKNYWNSPSNTTLSMPIPFPYKVAKSLSAECIRNVEYDVWLESKRIDPLFLRRYSPNTYNNQVNCSSPISPGDKCQVTLPGRHDEVFNAYIQELHIDSNMASIFVEGIGEKHKVQLSDIKLISKVDDNGLNWRKRSRGRRLSETFGNSKSFETENQQSSFRKFRINSSGFATTDFENNQFERSYRGSLDALPHNSTSKSRIRALSDGQGLGFMGRDNVSQDNDFREDDEAFANSDNISRNFYNMNIQEPEVNFNSNMIMMMPKDDIVTLAKPESATLPVEEASQSFVYDQTRMVPYQNVQWMTLGENIIGPVNYGAQPSVDMQGTDLPFDDMNTLRFFYNLGIQYYRISMIQQHQQQQASCIYLPPGTPLVMSDMYLMSDGGDNSNRNFICSSDVPGSTSAFYFPSVPATPTPISPYFLNPSMPFN